MKSQISGIHHLENRTETKKPTRSITWISDSVKPNNISNQTCILPSTKPNYTITLDSTTASYRGLEIEVRSTSESG
jgi:hypothetical protein